MMKRPWLFGLVTFLVAWILQVLLCNLSLPGTASPNLVLLIVLSLGVMGHVTMALVLGFFWGLGMDVMGISLFGSQGLLMVWAAYIAVQLSRQLNAEKLVTQEAMSLFGTLFLAVGINILEHLFRTTPAPRVGSPLGLIVEILLNGLMAPLVFWLIQKWTYFWIVMEGSQPIHK
jgi:rod shape-determining protein MreD